MLHRLPAQAPAVSIHARHCWRANPSTRRLSCMGTNVSIHARHCWRANPLQGRKPPGHSKVSIHARHCWRANPSFFFISVSLVMFQSTPAIAGGRTRAGTRAPPTAPECFNPRPPLLAGEPIVQAADHATCGSFNPRPPLLAGEPIASHRFGNCQACFNPRPPLLAGEPASERNTARLAAVSIHARHCWRANPALLELVPKTM